MSRRLPPLNTLRAFEAAARHLSFTRAAAELHVTQAAISHQIKALEGYLGVRLFRRLTRQLLLTEEGQILLPVVREAFDRIAETAEGFGRNAGRRSLAVSLMPAFGANWLAPRIGRFLSEHTDIDLRLHHSNQMVDFSRDEVDMAVRWGPGSWSGVIAEPLLGMRFAPVCSPALLVQGPPLRAPEDLKHHTLLHDADYEGWTQWLARAGISDINPRRGSIIDDSNVLTHAALDGQGVALCGLGLVAGHLQAGRLVQPFELTIETGSAYYIVYPPKALERPLVKAFRDWLLAEVRGMPD